MAYIGRQQDGFGVRSRFIYTATGGQTTFTTDDSSNALSYSDGAYVDVYLNGVLLDPSDYTATSLTSIVLDSGATASDILEVIVYDVFSVFSGTFTNGITASEATVTGDLTVDTDTLKVDSTNNRVGIGTTSPSRALATKSSSVTVANFESTSGTAGLISFSDSNTTDDVHVRAGAVGDNLVLQAGGAERMRIDSSGNVIVGATSFNSGLTSFAQLEASNSTAGGIVINTETAGASNYGRLLFTVANGTGQEGLIRYNTSNYHMSFWTNATERMRISGTSPALSIGKTTFGTSGGGFTVYGNTVPQCYFNKTHDGAVNGVLFYYSDTYVGGLNYSNTATSLATSSDERLKDNIENSDDAGAKIDAMQVRQFDWKSTGEHQEYGFVAQELEPIFAHAVHTDKEGEYKSVDYACLVPMLVKEIQSLRQRITDLENA